MTYLTVENARKMYGEGVRALDGISFRVEPAEFFTLLGPSGCGKTTLLRSIAGFSDLTEGSIDLAGNRPATTCPPTSATSAWSSRTTPYFPHLTVCRQRRLRPQGHARCPRRETRDAGRRKRWDRAAREPRRTPAGSPVRRPAAAHRPRPRHGDQPAPPAHGRAAVQSRRQAAGRTCATKSATSRRRSASLRST